MRAGCGRIAAHDGVVFPLRARPVLARRRRRPLASQRPPVEGVACVRNATGCDFLIVGSGVAGLLTALHAARHGNVVLATKRAATDSNTNWAQGGIAAVTSAVDSFERHVDDTLAAGAGICRRDVVEMVVRRGPAVIRALAERGARFSHADGALALGREGGHSAPRIVHFADQTGREIERALYAAVRAEPRIEVRENCLAVNLIGGRPRAEAGAEPVRGAYLLDVLTARVAPLAARVTVLATGGCGKAYLYTSNPDVATGDGIAMAFRAGARVANLEFVQFHPTCLYNTSGSRFLISEAVRGEGAVLRDAAGTAFMSRYDARADLAPRDVVARAIDIEMKKSGDKCVYLDARPLGAEFLQHRFPNIYAACAALGVRMERDPVPVVPAAHYMCGGVLVDHNGKTDLPSLYALGETSCTGLHGANRLASNSLLEALVYAERVVADALERDCLGGPAPAAAPWSDAGTTEPDAVVLLDHDWDATRRLMWDHVGIVRSDERLDRARARLAILRRDIENDYWRYRLSSDLVELRNIALVGELVVRCARFRRESRGLHHTSSWPNVDPAFAGDTVLSRWQEPHLVPTAAPIVTEPRA
jgi:L-aspartate oxidase